MNPKHPSLPTGINHPVTHEDDFQPTAAPSDNGERFKVTTKVKHFVGDRGGVKFSGGTAFTNDQDKAEHCRRLGYFVEDRQGGTEGGAQ